MVSEQTIRMTSPDGTESVVEIDQELWDRFAARAEDLGVSEEDAFLAAMSGYLESQGYEVIA